MPSASTTNAQETANTPNVATQETEEARTAREASEARAERARHRSLHRTPKGKAAWDKDRTRELFRQYKATGDPEGRDQLIVSHLNLVRFLASKFKNRGEPLDDLIQVGTIGLIKAIDRFDPSRGLEFTTYATPTILGEIKRHFRDKGWSVRVPRRLQELSAKVNQANDELTNELSRSPSVEEIAKRVGASVDDVLEAMESSSAYSSVPLEGGGSSDDDDAPSVIDHYAPEAENRLGRPHRSRGCHQGLLAAREGRHPHALLRGHDAGRDRRAPGHLSGAGLSTPAPHAPPRAGQDRPRGSHEQVAPRAAPGLRLRRRFCVRRDAAAAHSLPPTANAPALLQ